MRSQFRFYGALLCIFLTLSTCCGCLLIPRSKLPKLEDYPPLAGSEQKATLIYSFASTFSTMGNSVRPSKEKDEELKYVFLNVFKESGFFSGIEPYGQGDINTEIRLLWYTNACQMLSLYLSIFTLGILPGYATESYFITASVTARNGIEKIYYIEEDGYTIVSWLPFIVWNINMPSDEYGRKIQKNMYKTLLLRMQRDGFFSAQNTIGAKPTNKSATNDVK